MALGETGQTSSQTTQGVSIAHGRQRPWLKNAVPTEIGPSAANWPRPSFFSTEIFWIAPVGQTSLQSVQPSWQNPIPMSITGVHKPSSPPCSSVEGWRTLVGQTLMHWSHLMQRSRNSLSSTEPGGRIAFLLNPRGFTDADNRRNGYASTPTTPVNNNRRRLRSGHVTSVSGILLITGLPNSLPSTGFCFFSGNRRNESASSGQSSMQLKHTKHSLLRKAAWGSDAPSQCVTHRLQSVQRVRSRSIRHSENRDSQPRNAPSGHNTRQKNRGITRFIPTRNR